MVNANPKTTQEASRNEAYRSEQRIQNAFQGLSVAERDEKKRSALAERAKYQFEAVRSFRAIPF